MRRFFRTAAAAALGIALCASAVSAQRDEPKVNIGGVLNHKAISLPVPEYPPAARAVRVEGTVNVQVLVDEGGSVVWAKAVNGHPLLRPGSEKAARRARFSSLLVNGKPVKVSGILVYNFVISTTTPMGKTGRSLVEAPNPEYPPAARAVRASGRVSVLVTVDAKGQVLSAQATGGHPLLRQASEKAARETKFSPISLDGLLAVQVTTVLTYEFTRSGAARLVRDED